MKVEPKMPVPRSFAPAKQRGIHELLDEAENYFSLGLSLIKTVRLRMEDFDRMQAQFYKGHEHVTRPNQAAEPAPEPNTEPTPEPPNS
jgi:hypothetical protein